MVFQFVVLQMLMHSPLLGLQTLSFPKVITTYLQTAKALARLTLCTGLTEPLLVAFVTSTLFSGLWYSKMANKTDPGEAQHTCLTWSNAVSKGLYFGQQV